MMPAVVVVVPEPATSSDSTWFRDDWWIQPPSLAARVGKLSPPTANNATAWMRGVFVPVNKFLHSPKVQQQQQHRSSLSSIPEENNSSSSMLLGASLTNNTATS
jgi:hypothetical protein